MISWRWKLLLTNTIFSAAYFCRSIQKINNEIKLDPELVKKLVTTRQLVIQKFQDLGNLSKIISSGNKAPTVRINLTTADGTLKKNELELM